MADSRESHYLSIGEVLGLLLEDFPDVTISKIRFLESQGLIEPERTPSGYRKFYDHDVDLLRAILHEQRENFLPLKVIRDRIESGAIDKDITAGRTPPRGIRNVDLAGQGATTAVAAEPRDSVFRRTDGGPEWADGRALVPGDSSAERPGSPITTAVPVTAVQPETPGSAPPPPVAALIEAPPVITAPAPAPAAAPVSTPAAAPPDPAPPRAPVPQPAKRTAAPVVASTPAPAPGSHMPYNREEFCAAAHISSAQLDELEQFGLISARGTGVDATYPPELLEIATVAGRFLAIGIDARHLRSWKQSADRESTLFESRIMPLLRQRNPQSRQLALDTLSELAELGGRLHNAIIQATLRHHFEGS